MSKHKHRMKPTGFLKLLAALTMPCVALSAADRTPITLPTNKPGLGEGSTTAALQAALQTLGFPGVAINLQERCVDVESSVCLHRGTLELVACTKRTKEHESIVAIAAKSMHVHAALLLLGATPGHPAMRKQTGEPAERWIDLPPSGGPVEVYLLLKDKEGKMVERPISDFIAPSGQGYSGPARTEQGVKFPTHTFIFAGSVLWGDGPGPRRYLSEESGNVISLSTFGDELLCLPGIHTQENGMLEWEVNATGLPTVGSNVTLRLRPQLLPTVKGAKAHQSPSNDVPGNVPQ